MTGVETALRTGAAGALGRALSDSETALLIKYMDLLVKWQRSQRLIGATEPRWIVDNVLVDSLLFARLLPARVATLCDVGSGAGIPGIPLKIVMPDTEVALLEARQKRASFLSAAIRELPLHRCRVVNERIENAGSDMVGRFEAVVMRCAGDPVALARDVKPLLTPRGVIVASGPPVAPPVESGEWVEVDGRRFWRYQAS